MPNGRFQVAIFNAANPLARDHIMNTFYLEFGSILTDDDWDQLCEDACGVWVSRGAYPQEVDTVRVTGYDMADAKPRVPKATHTAAIAGIAQGGPREVACCLSYFAGVNRPRTRGRMYMGPWQQSDCGQRPDSGVRGRLETVAEGISGLGGIDTQWVQYSPTTNTFHDVSDFWIDDEWDTVRSRGLRATTRLTGTVSG